MTQPHPSPRSLDRLDVTICLALALSIAVIYAQVITHEFVNLDDLPNITQNRNVTGGLTPAAIAWAFRDVSHANWQPLTWITHMIDVELFGVSAGPHLVINALFHLASSLLLFVLLKRSTNSRWRSATVAALFALHPLRVESVAWLSERKDVLSTFFFMLTLLAYSSYVRRRSMRGYLLLLLAFGAGLMSKPMLVTLPFVLLLLDYWPLSRLERFGQLPRLLLEKAPLIAMSVATASIAWIAQRGAGAVSTLEVVSLAGRLGNALSGYLWYIGKILWPSRLAVIYPLHGPPPATMVVAAALVLAAVTAVVVWQRGRRPYLIVGWLWFLGTLLPVIGLVQIGSQAYADRYSYIPSIGAVMALVWVTAEALPKTRAARVTAVAVSTVALIALTSAASIQASHWKDSFTLFSHAVNVTRDNGLAHTNLALALATRGEREQAFLHFKKALTSGKVRIIQPSDNAAPPRRIYPSWYPDAFNGLAMLHLDAKRPDAAIAELRKAQKLRPRDPKILHHLGVALNSAGRSEEAATLHQQSLAAAPDDLDTKLDLGNALLGQGRVDEALRIFDEVIAANPRSANARNNRASALARMGKEDQAVLEYMQALHLDPTLYDVHLNLGAILSRGDRLDEAILHFREAARLQPALIEPKIYLGLGLLQAGSKAEAAQIFSGALAANAVESESVFCSAVRQPCSGHLLRDYVSELSQP